MTYGIWPPTDEQFCDYDPSSQTCDIEEYGVMIGFGYGFPGMVVASLLAMMFGIVMCIYNCTRPFVPRKAFPLNYLNPEHYGGNCFPLTSGWICRIIACFLCVLAIVFLIIAIGIDGQVYDSTKVWWERTIDFANDEVDQVESDIQALEATQLNSYINGTTSELYSQARDYIDEFKDFLDYSDYVYYVMLAKLIVEIVFFVIVMGLFVLTIVSMILGYSVIVMLLITISTIFILPLSLFYSYCIMSDALYNDICEDLDVIIDNGNSAIKYGILPCDLSDRAGFSSSITDTLNDAQNQTCSSIDDACSIPGVYCDNVECDLENIGNITNQIIIQDTLICGDPACPPDPCTPGDICYANNVTMKECIDSCQNSYLQELSNETDALAADAQTFSDIIYGQFFPLLNCEFLPQYARDIKDPLCEEMINIGIVGLFTLFTVATLVLILICSILIHNNIEEHKKIKKENGGDWDDGL